ncbi:NAD(P)H-hydrate epimerase [Galbitalea sp. SE-J8]|uniref:NAD(P)H-hydrate epimerase n=1 Tax=Galbitalea sp. SE-J8 TaxID=3054952 RepID=UPI00259CF3EB|nr:NAD(P)H-hydrate epimerase [Galbitalea sp. SE-J8]MDM4763966.1 NAD(P)H-hydrate epimerase [Galbitalea sp. SE-J8]
MKGYSAAQVRAAERPHLDAGEPLMERAAAALAAAIADEVGESATILVLVGAGNNGGDALYAAATLAGGGHDIRLARTSDRVHAAGLAAALEAGAQLTADPVGVAQDADVIVDAILGTGSGGSTDGAGGSGSGSGTSSSEPDTRRSAGSAGPHALRGRAREVVAALLPLLDGPDDAPLVVAVDLPSGIDPDTGAATDAVVLPAGLTVTFGAAKAGLLIEPGASLAGEILVADLGLGPELAQVEPLIDS